MSGHPVLPAETRSPCRCCRCATWSSSRTWSSRCSWADRSRSRRSKPPWKRAARSCWWRRRPPARTSPSPTTCSRSAASRSILQMLKLPDGTVKVLVEGVQRANTHRITENGDTSSPTSTPVPPENDAKPEIEALRRAVTQQFDQYVKLNKKIPPEILDLHRRHRRRRPPGRHHRRAPAAEARATSRRCWTCSTSPSGWKSCSSSSSTKSTSCRSKSASAAASSARWRRASASTT